jgi:hypothetical protein
VNFSVENDARSFPRRTEIRLCDADAIPLNDGFITLIIGFKSICPASNNSSHFSAIKLYKFRGSGGEHFRREIEQVDTRAGDTHQAKILKTGRFRCVNSGYRIFRSVDYETTAVLDWNCISDSSLGAIEEKILTRLAPRLSRRVV